MYADSRTVGVLASLADRVILPCGSELHATLYTVVYHFDLPSPSAPFCLYHFDFTI